jgi:methanogenic corrinoid protein MtbC1
MIKWCAYCQKYLGETPPFDRLVLTHGLCPECAAKNRMLDPDDTGVIEPVVEFFRDLRKAGKDGIIPGPAEWINKGAAMGIRPADMLIGMLQPALYEIGELWSRGEVTVEKEHRFSAFADAVTGLIYAHYPELGRKRQHANPDILLTNADGNYHTLGIKFLEVLMLSRGYSTFTVLPGLPAREVIALAAGLKCRVIGVSVALVTQLRPVMELALDLKELPGPRRPRLVVGGLPIKEGVKIPPELGIETCADITAFSI